MSTHFAALTSKQKKVYSAIESYIRENGIPPTVREIGEMLGEKTPGAVQGILNRLEQKGVIRRQVGMARSIKLVSPESTLYLSPVYVPEIRRITMRNIGDLLNIYNIMNYQPVSPKLVSSDETCFIFSCPDNSMADSGIKYKDNLIVKMLSGYKDGDIVLALYDNHVLLRRYVESSQQGHINLEADNYLIDKKVFNKDEVTIIGKVIIKYTVY